MNRNPIHIQMQTCGACSIFTKTLVVTETNAVTFRATLRREMLFSVGDDDKNEDDDEKVAYY